MSGNEVASPRSGFLLLWTAQFLSLIGTDITKFALRVWTYEKSSSVAQYGLLIFFTEMPALILSPIVGVFVDRYHRKKIMMFSDSVSMLSTVLIYFLFANDILQIWHLYVLNCLGSIMNAFQWPAFTASMSLMIPSDQLARFGGLNQAAPALSMLFSPTLAGILLQHYHLKVVFLVEFVTFVFAIFVTSNATIPVPPKSKEGQEGKGSLWSELGTAWMFIRSRPALVALLVLLANSQFCNGLVQVLLTPLILNFASPWVLGYVLTVSGTGALFGSLILVVWGGPRRKIYGVLSCSILQGLLLASCGLSPNAWLILFVAFTYMSLIPLVRVCRESIWQQKVPPDLQGRVFALQRTIGQTALPLASVLAGTLADNIFEPALAPGGLLSDSVGIFIGTGPGRGCAFFFIVLGGIYILASLVGFLYGPLRRVDTDLPDLAKNTKSS